MTVVRLGILLSRRPTDEGPFGPHSALVRRMSSLGLSEGVEVVAFAAGDIDRRSHRVAATRYLGALLGWETEDMPLPHVLWNRCLKRDREGVLRWCQLQGVHLLNSLGLTKWEAHRSLRPFSEHLPETRLLREADVLFELLERYPTVFIKPVRGAVGRGIIRSQRDGKGLRLSYISSQSGAPKSAAITEDQFEDWLDRGDRAGRYIVQQGLELLTYDGRPADIRALVQKDGLGRWSVTGMGARVAAPGRFTSNLHTGGQAIPVTDLLAGNAMQPEEVLADLEALALGIVERIEAVAGPMGEIGIDFGIDRGGQIWVIEQNVRPGRAIFEHLGCRERFDLAHLRPLQYARHLALAQIANGAWTRAT